MMNRSFDVGNLLVGFLAGFILGCCGLLGAAAFFREYIPGVVMGFGARIGLGLLVAATNQVAFEAPIPEVTFGEPAAPGVPWELVAAFVVGTVALTALIGAAVWAFAPMGGDDDDDDGPEPPSRYVSYTR